MGLIAGKTAYACCLAVGRSGNDPDTSKEYIKFAIPIESLDNSKNFLDKIDHVAGGLAFSDLTGTNKNMLQVQRSIIEPAVQSSAMAEINAITDALDGWCVTGASPIYFFWVINSVNKTFTDGSGNHNQYLACGLRSYRLKAIGINTFEFSFILENRDY